MSQSAQKERADAPVSAAKRAVKANLESQELQVHPDYSVCPAELASRVNAASSYPPEKMAWMDKLAIAVMPVK